MTALPMPEWMPDLPDHLNAGLIVCKNTVSRTAVSYGPFSAPVVYSDALPARCQGAFTARTSAGEIEIYAGTASGLYRLVSGTTAWEDVSKVGGYTTAADALWSFCQYGDRIIATNGIDPIQSYVMGTSTDFADLSASAPVASFVAVVKEFVMAARISGFPQRVQWCAQGDPTNWPTPGTSAAAQALSDYQDLLEGDGGWVQGLVSGLEGADVVVFMERQIVRGVFVGPDLIFQFKTVEGVRGTPSPGSLNKFGSNVPYLGEDGYYSYNGTVSVPIGANRFDKTFFEQVDNSYLSNISSAVDPITKNFFWAWPDSSAIDGVPNWLLSWNWSTNRATLIEIEGGCEFLFRAGAFGSTLEGLDALGFTLETLPFSLDSRFWTGGRSLLAMFNSDHELCFFTGSALEAEYETGEPDGGMGNMMHVSGVRPLVDAANVYVSLGYRDDLDDSVSYTSTSSQEDDGVCSQRVCARYVRAKITVPAGETWTHISGYEPKMKRAGRR
jgi:hypothetical protein